ncbi:serine/threonine-protein kinase VRK3 isoform 3-T3 [Alca torda]
MAGRGRRGPAAAERLGPEREPEAAGASLRGSRFCPQCGRGVEPVFRFCPACGGRLPPLPREEETEQAAPAPPRQQARGPAAPLPGPPVRAPAACRPSGRSPRKARCGPAVPLPAEAVLTDWGGRQWRLVRLLEQGGCGLMYEGCQRWQNLQRTELLPASCEGRHRFLVFSDLGRTLQSVLNDGLYLLREKAAFQIVVRLLDCLEYIHENEYVHGDITAENIYLNPADLTQVTLAGYCFAFRYCPGGKHVAQREGSRTPHEGTMEFISLDSHKGAGPSRRSDLESLGYCLLKWLSGSLPWSDELDKVESVVEKKEKYKGDVTCLLRVCFMQRPIPAKQGVLLPIFCIHEPCWTDALQSYLQQVMALEYEEKPHYEGLRQLFKKPLEKMKSSAYDPVDIKMVP